MYLQRTVIEDFCEPSNELRIAFWFQMLEQKLRMSLEVLEVSFRARWKKRLRILILPLPVDQAHVRQGRPEPVERGHGGVREAP